MHDDLVPEEGEQAYTQLLALLRSSSQKRVPIEATEQAQIIARVRERLVQKDQGDSLNGKLPVPQPGVLDSSPHQAESPAGKPHRDKRRLRLMALLAAAMIVAVLLGTPLLLLRPRLLSSGGYNQATKTPAGPPTLTLSPTVATIGSTIQLSIKNFTPNTRVALTRDIQEPLRLEGGSSIITVGPAGSVHVAVTLDSGWRTGFHLIVAEDLRTHYTASATILITGRGPTQTYASFVATNGIMFGFDAQHTHFNPFEHILNPTTVGGLTKKWTYQAEGTVFSSPVVAGGVVYVGCSCSYLYALDAATGAKKWAYWTGGSQVTDSPAVVGGVVYFSSDDGTLHALDAATGMIKWAYQTRGPIGNSSPTVVGGVVYFGSWDGNVYALDAATGAKKWAYPIGHYVDSPPAVADGVVYVGSDNGNVYALDAATGAKKWAYQTGNRVEASPAVADGVVYVGSVDDGTLYALDAATGAKKWTYHTNGQMFSSPTVANGVVYVGSDRGNEYALDAVSGAKKWAYPLATDSSATVADGVVYVSVFAFHLPGT